MAVGYIKHGDETDRYDVAFLKLRSEPGAELSLKYLPTGFRRNDPAQGEDWAVNYYTTITKMPELRIRYEEVQEVL